MQVDWPLGRMFSFLTKQYIGEMVERMKNTPVQRYYYALFIIGKYSGKISQQELANHLLMDKVSLVRILDVLMEDGFILRTVNPSDRRQHLLSITEKAEPWILEIEQGLKDTTDHFIGFLPEDQQENFMKSLQLLICKTQDIPSDSFELFYTRKDD